MATETLPRRLTLHFATDEEYSLMSLVPISFAGEQRFGYAAQWRSRASPILARLET